MQQSFRRRALPVLQRLVIGLVTIAVILIAAGPFRLFEQLELAAYDGWFSLRGEVEPHPEIVIIGIDDASLAQIGRWPWDRAVYAQLLDYLSEASVVAFDLLLLEPNDRVPGDDQTLANAIARHERVVLSTLIRIEEVRGQFNTIPQRPIPVLLEAVRGDRHKFYGQGIVNTPIGEDSVIRAYIPVDSDTFGEPYPSLALAAVMQHRGYTPDQIEATPFGALQAGALQIPRDPTGQMLINFAGEPASYPTISFADVYNGKRAPSEFAGKIVFVGTVADTLKDNFPVPFAKDTTVTMGMPGVEIQASAAATMLQGNSVTRVSHGTNMLITLALGLIVLLLAYRLSPLWGGLSLLVLAGGFVMATYLLWSQSRLWVDVVTPATGSILIYTIVTLESYLREEAEKRRVRNLFGRYVSHNVVNELLQNPDMLQMGGKRFNLTILFSDIRGFTSFSESRDPQEVVQRINDYCKDMVDIIYKHGGTLDKYMGDGIMAYFGAPVPQEDHAERALRCAHEMREKIKELQKAWVEQGLQPFQIGVGMNSGEVIAGNIGHPDRVEYSLIGSAVNLAARLEGMTKEYARSEAGGIVFSEMTYQGAPQAVETYQPTEIGEVEVRGLAHKVRIYTM